MNARRSELVHERVDLVVEPRTSRHAGSLPLPATEARGRQRPARGLAHLPRGTPPTATPDVTLTLLHGCGGRVGHAEWVRVGPGVVGRLLVRGVARTDCGLVARRPGLALVVAEADPVGPYSALTPYDHVGGHCFALADTQPRRHEVHAGHNASRVVQRDQPGRRCGQPVR